MSPPEQALSVPQALRSATEHFRAGRYSETEQLCRQVLAVDPDEPDALYLLGLTAQRAGRSDEAISLVGRAVRQQPANAFFAGSLGEMYLAARRPADAEQCFRQALASDPGSAGTHESLGAALLEMKQFAKAEQSFRASLALKADSANAHNGLGIALNEVGRSDEAELSYRAALAIEPDFAEARSNLGKALRDMGRTAEAVESCRQALALRPGAADAHVNLGLALFDLGEVEGSEAAFRAALALAPGDTEAKFNLSLARLLQGDYETGLASYESRLDRAAAGRGASPARARLGDLPDWRQKDPRGKRLLVWAEQGFGDNLMAMRYLPELKERGVRRIAVFCEPALARIMQSFDEVDEVITGAASVRAGDFDCHCPMMSLPLMFGTRLETIPDRIPYVHVPIELRRQWRDKLARAGSPRVGIVWTGGQSSQIHARRSLALENLLPVLNVAGPEFVSLQKGGAEQIRRSGRALLDRMDECADFLDTAALIEQLDLVISIDTAVAHLAGALGKPVWLLVRFESDWRWMLKREDSPWYPTMRIFRQSRIGDWDEVVARVAAALRERFA